MVRRRPGYPSAAARIVKAISAFFSRCDFVRPAYTDGFFPLLHIERLVDIIERDFHSGSNAFSSAFGATLGAAVFAREPVEIAGARSEIGDGIEIACVVSGFDGFANVRLFGDFSLTYVNA